MSPTTPPTPARPESLLHVEGVRAGYGDVEVLRGVTLDVAAGEVVALVGANGVGKTTLLRAVSGLVRPTAGVIRLDGARIDGLAPDAIVARGLLQVPEGRKIFPSLTVGENLDLGAYVPVARARRGERRERVFALFPVLAERRRQLAGTLSGGEQQMLAIGRGLMGGPRLLALDEPSLGLAPVIVDRIFDVLRAIHADGVTVLLVEQNVRRSLAIADRAFVLEHGGVALTGAGRDLLARDDVRRTYLGL